MTVYVCPSRDIECGDDPRNWCFTCPQQHGPRWVEADCRTCTRHYTDKGQQVGCSSIVACVGGDRYQALPPVRLWRKT